MPHGCVRIRSAYVGTTVPTALVSAARVSSNSVAGGGGSALSLFPSVSADKVQLVSDILKKKVKEFLAKINGCTQAGLYRLTTLVLRDVPLKDPFFLRTLFVFISRLSTVTTLKFEGAFLGNLNQIALTTLVENMPLLHNIRTIDLSSNDLGNLNEDELTAMLSKFAAMANVTKLIFNSNNLHNLSMVGWQTIFTELLACPMFSELSFRCNFLGSLDQDCCENFMRGLASLDKLKVLDLGGNGFGWACHESWQVFADGLAHLTNLENLNLSNNHFGQMSDRQERLSFLLHSVSQMRGLTNLCLDSNKLCLVDEKEWLLVENAFSKLSRLNLVVFFLEEDAFSEEGVRRVYALQEQFPRVRVFNKYLGMKYDPRIQKMLAGIEEEEKEEEEETDKE